MYFFYKINYLGINQETNDTGIVYATCWEEAVTKILNDYGEDQTFSIECFERIGYDVETISMSEINECAKRVERE